MADKLKGSKVLGEQKGLKKILSKGKSKLLLISLVLILVIFLNPVFPVGSFLLLDVLLDIDIAQSMAQEEFERQNPDLDARGGRHIFFDPLAYTIEVMGYTKNAEGPSLYKKELYRVYWWGTAVKSENMVTEFLRSVHDTLFY